MTQQNHVESFKCPACGATIEIANIGDRTVKCAFCGAPAAVPESLLKPATMSSDVQAKLSPADLKAIVKALQNHKKLDAIKVYRAATPASLEVAKGQIELIELDMAAGRIRP